MELTAKWIWAESCLDIPNCYVYTRKEFSTDVASSAEAFAACTGEYKLYVNGRYVGRGANYGQNYNTHDLSHVLRSGKNVIAAICYSPSRQGSGRDVSPAGFALQLGLTRNGEPEQFILTDETWKTKMADEWDADSAPIHAPERYQEIYDSRRKPVGWNVVGFDDSSWPDPAVTNESGIRLPPRQIPPLREREVHPTYVIECGTVMSADESSTNLAARIYAEPTHPDSTAIKYPKEMLTSTGDAAVVPAGVDSYVVLDFGSEIVGYPCLRIRGGGQAAVDIAYSEVLDRDGRVWPTRGGLVQADRLILHGGRQEWQTFGRRVSRYVQLTFREVRSPISIESFSVSSVGYPVEQATTFECSDELLNKIWHTGVYALSLCMQDRYESSAGSLHQCAADARLQALFNYYCFFDSALAAQALEQTFEDAQVQSDGLTWVEMLHEYYRYTGDVGLVNQLYPMVGNLLGAHAEDEAATQLALHIQALRTASKLAAVVSSTDDAARWHEQANELHRLFNERFWNEAKSMYRDDGELGSSARAGFLAIALGLADADRSGRILERLFSGRLAEFSAPVHLFCALAAMARMNESQQALDVIRSEWGRMLDRGATTWWAHCPSEPSELDEVGLCDGASSAPTYFLPAEILGVKPSSPEHIVIQPRVGDLQWAKGRIKTAAGYADVAWHNEDGVFRIDIEAPPGFIVALPIGGFIDPVIDEIDLSPETPERRARKTYGWGTTIWRGGIEHDPYLDWLASQSTEPPSSYTHRDRCAADAGYVWVRESISNHVRYEIREA